MEKLIGILKRSSLARSERGGIVLITLLAFIVLSVPLAVGANTVSSQLSRSSQTYDELLQESYDAGAAIEYGFSRILDPDFTDALLPGAPITLYVDINGEPVELAITEIPTSKVLQGQGLVTINKTVTSTSAPVEAGTLETFHYEISIRNEGTDTVTLEQVVDYLPPLITYAGPTGGNITSNNPAITTNDGVILCGDTPGTLTWDITPSIDILPDEKKTLSFEASGTLTEGTYYNQVRVRYRPWWDESALVDIYTPYTALITVSGSGSPQECGFDLDLLMGKSLVDVQTLDSGEKEATYTITIQNVFDQPLPLNNIEDLLPPDFTYVDGSTSGSVTSADPTEVLDPDLQRWRLTWGDGSSPMPLFSVGAGDTETLTFKATGTVEVGLEYYNEVLASYSGVAGRKGNADIVLTLDSFGDLPEASDTDALLAAMKAAANSIVDAFDLATAEGRIRFSVTKFKNATNNSNCGNSQSIAHMTDYDKELTDPTHPSDVPIHEGIDKMKLSGQDLTSGTNIVKGIKCGVEQLDTGLGERPGVPNIMILATDTEDTLGNLPADMQAEVQKWIDAGKLTEVFAIGVGTDADLDVLEAIATDPDNVFSLDDFDALIAIIDDIIEAIEKKALVLGDGGASINASISGGRYYDLEAVAQDGTIQVRVLLAGGQITLLSWQKN